VAISFTIEHISINGKLFDDAELAFNSFATQMEESSKELFVKLEANLKQTLEAIVETLTERHGNPWNGIARSDNLYSRTGGGLRMLAESLRVSGNSLANLTGNLTVPSGLVFHERGGTIKAKTAQYLTIPLPSAMDGRGVALRAKARDWEDTFVAKSRAGNLLIFQKTGASINPLYVLKPSVQIPARLAFEETCEMELGLFTMRATDILADMFGGI
jgi:hypothetical protein